MLTAKNRHLLFSACILIPIAFAYGIAPDFSFVLNFEVKAIDLKNILRAIMGLYLGMASFWLLGIVRPHYWRAATILNIMFMGGLATGRLLSWMVDGQSSLSFFLAMWAEFIIAAWGIWSFKKYKDFLPRESL